MNKTTQALREIGEQIHQLKINSHIQLKERKEVKDTPQTEVSCYIQQISEIHKLRKSDSLSEEESKNLKSILIKRMTRSLEVGELASEMPKE